MSLNAILSTGLLALATTAELTTPNLVYPAAPSTKLEKSVANGKLYTVEKITSDATTTQSVRLLHIYGTPFEMGEANGLLMGERILDFLNNGLPSFYDEEIASIPFLSKLPLWLQKIIEKTLDKDAPGAADQALTWVYEAEKKFIDPDASNFEQEVAGMATGVCNVSVASGVPCDVETMTNTIRHINLLPELIKMSCSMLGAWGAATSEGPMQGDLIQMRTLDFGPGPFANASVITVYHPSSGGNTWANVGFPAMVGAVTGMSTKVALSEKIWLVRGQSGPQPGTYHGKPDIMVIRDMLQFANTKEEAEAMAQATNRTWATFLGVGDFASQEMNIMAYREKDVVVLTDDTAPSYTNQTTMKDLIYVDKHPQPSTDDTLPNVLNQLYGNITATSIATNVPRLTQSGDVHAAVYDFKNSQMYVSLGLTNADGNYGNDGSGLACNRPFFQFDMNALFNEKMLN